MACVCSGGHNWNFQRMGWLEWDESPSPWFLLTSQSLLLLSPLSLSLPFVHLFFFLFISFFYFLHFVSLGWSFKWRFADFRVLFIFLELHHLRKVHLAPFIWLCKIYNFATIRINLNTALGKEITTTTCVSSRYTRIVHLIFEKLHYLASSFIIIHY